MSLTYLNVFNSNRALIENKRACAPCRSLYVHHIVFFIFVVGFSVTEDIVVLKAGIVLASLACWQVCFLQGHLVAKMGAI